MREQSNSVTIASTACCAAWYVCVWNVSAPSTSSDSLAERTGIGRWRHESGQLGEGAWRCVQSIERALQVNNCTTLSECLVADTLTITYAFTRIANRFDHTFTSWTPPRSKYVR